MLTPGTIVHERYRIEQLVGQGAMGAVYAAVDLRLGHTVALKHTRIPGPAGAAALDREAQILTQLAHPGLPTVSDTFTTDEGQCLVMSFIPGPTLAELLDERGTGFPPDMVLTWADQILGVLDYLHGRQPPVLHRDIKPQNLKLTPAGAVVLLDFGLARGQLFQTNLAGQRSVIGYTLPYAPLEQVRGEDTDPRSDLFALAGTLAHLLVGAPPPDALTRAAAILAGGPDPLQAYADALPSGLRAVLLACLSLDLARRPANAAALRATLARLPDDAAVDTSTSEPERTQAAWRLAEGLVHAIALMLVVAALAALTWLPREAQPAGVLTPTDIPGVPTPVIELTLTALAEPFPPEPPLVPTMASLLQPTLVSGWVAAPTPAVSPLTPDGGPLLSSFQAPPLLSGLVRAGDGGTFFATTLQSVLALDATAGRVRAALIDPLGNVGMIALSPSGSRLAAGTRDGVRLWQVADGVLITTLPHAVPVSALAFTPDGHWLITGDTAGQVHLWDMTDDMRKATWAVSEYPAEHGAVRGLAVSPDGAVVALAQDRVRICRLTDGYVLSTLPLTAGESTALANPQAVVFAPDGATIAVGYSEGTVQFVARATGVIERSVSGEGPVEALAFSPDGAYLATGSDTGVVQIWGLGEGDTGRTLPGHGSPVQGLVFDADSSTLAVTMADGVVQQWRVAP